MYDPILGRLIQRDPLGGETGTSLYQYADSRPTFATDPSGKWPTLIGSWWEQVRLQLVKEWTPALIKELESETFLTRKRAETTLGHLLLDPTAAESVRCELEKVLKSRPTLELRRRIESILEQPEKLRQRISKLLHTMCLAAGVLDSKVAQEAAVALAKEAETELAKIINDHSDFVTQEHKTGSIYTYSQAFADESADELRGRIGNARYAVTWAFPYVAKCMSRIKDTVGRMLEEAARRRKNGG
jgi:hypothetical protein